MATHYDIFRLRSAESTQDEARRRMDTRDVGAVPVLVLADAQLSGRGRQGREWAQPDRGLFASLAFTSEWSIADRTLIPLCAGVAMRRVVAAVLDLDVGLKWPNDLIVEHAKVGGILVETTKEVVVVGCGLNLYWRNPVDGAGALLPGDQGSEMTVVLAERWVAELLAILDNGASQWPREEYEAASVTIRTEVSWDHGHGRAVGIADDGALIVDSNGSQVELHSGEVHMQDRG